MLPSPINGRPDLAQYSQQLMPGVQAIPFGDTPGLVEKRFMTNLDTLGCETLGAHDKISHDGPASGPADLPLVEPVACA